MNGHSPISGRRPFQMLIDLPEFHYEGLPLFEITLSELHQTVQTLAPMVAAHRLVQGDHHTSSTGLLSGLYEGKGCRRMRPAESSTYFSTRSLAWLASLSTA